MLKEVTYLRNINYNKIGFLNKKAISPLIATVLLIAFAVALGAIIMNWGKTYVEQEMESSRIEYYAIKECERDIELKIKEVGNRLQLCYTYDGSTNLTIDFMLENTGPKTIGGVRVTAIGADSSVNSTGSNFLIENTTIAAGEILYNITTFVVPPTFGSLVQVEFAPFLNTTGSAERTLCSKKALIKTEIAIC